MGAWLREGAAASPRPLQTAPPSALSAPPPPPPSLPSLAAPPETGKRRRRSNGARSQQGRNGRGSSLQLNNTGGRQEPQGTRTAEPRRDIPSHHLLTTVRFSTQPHCHHGDIRPRRLPPSINHRYQRSLRRSEDESHSPCFLLSAHNYTPPAVSSGNGNTTFITPQSILVPRYFLERTTCEASCAPERSGAIRRITPPLFRLER